MTFTKSVKGMNHSSEKIDIINILDFKNAVSDDIFNSVLSSFSCEKNSDIEHFIKQNAYEFARKKISVTYLVFRGKQLLGIFTLTSKILIISANKLSKSKRNKIARYANSNENDLEYAIPAFLIAQFGKNDNISNNISGTQLMNYTITILRLIQHHIGGGVIFLECENKAKLLNFYSKNGFVEFSERKDTKSNINYIQMIRIF